MLPPPTVEVAGQPATATGVGPREFGELSTGLLGANAPDRLVRSAQERLPQSGMLPPGPGGTMTRPEATPPPTSPRPMEPAPPRPATGLYEKPPEPPVEIAPRNPKMDAQTVDIYRQAVRPSGGGRSREPQVTGYEDNVVRGVDKLVEHRPNLKLTTPQGVDLPPGTAPRTMRQFAEGIDQTKTALFEKWNPMTVHAGEAGLRIDLAPVVSELRSLATKPEVAHVNPAVVSQLERFADIYEKQGFYTPLETQGVIKGINQRLKSFYEKGEAASGAPAEVLEPVARLLRKQLDEGIEQAVGPGWQELRRDYGALSAIEKDVTRAAERLAKKPEGVVGKLSDFVGGTELVHALMTLSPHALARAVGAKATGVLYRHFNNPNRMIKQLFDKRIAGPRQPYGQSLDPFMGPAVRGGAVGIGSGGFPSQGSLMPALSQPSAENPSPARPRGARPY